MAEFLTAALEDDSPDVFLVAVGYLAKSWGMIAIAERAGFGVRACTRRSRRGEAAL